MPRIPPRVVLTVVSAAAVCLPSAVEAERGWTSWASVLEHFLVALVVLYVAYSILATVIAWYELEGMVRRRARLRQAGPEREERSAPS